MTEPRPLALFVRWPARSGSPERRAAATVAAFERLSVDLPDVHVAGLLIDGTAAPMPPDAIRSLLAAVEHRFGIAAGCEITLETPPGEAALFDGWAAAGCEITLETPPGEAALFDGWAAAGVNRLALCLGRFTRADHEALRAATGRFARVAADLSYGWPGHELASWRHVLEEVARSGAGHVSLDEEAGDGDEAADLYLLADDVLGTAGLPRYETVNFARPGQESRQNEHVWLGGGYLGIGPAAVGRIDRAGERIATTGHADDEAWLAAVEAGGDGLAERIRLDPATRRDELFVSALRRREGLPHAVAQAVLGRSIEDVVSARALRMLTGDGFLDLDTQGLRATDRGAVVLDSILVRLLEETGDPQPPRPSARR
ncbi:hypothetical protein [Marinivivus vitaminiproducens]|uniref:hypothetical protein n=1 Tax=Marinivivus vitaminiproducens TaxID=3035935 RepID=UPI0027A94EF4|nr:hypothetical protein P4R82_13270 [Geminicoccaceae bacterium SCSIO 64248]